MGRDWVFALGLGGAMATIMNRLRALRLISYSTALERVMIVRTYSMAVSTIRRASDERCQSYKDRAY